MEHKLRGQEQVKQEFDNVVRFFCSDPNQASYRDPHYRRPINEEISLTRNQR